VSTIPSSTWFTVSPEWGWLIVFYFFFGGLAGGSYFIAALVDLLGRPEDRPLARLAYLIVLPCLAVCAVLLIVDLSRPDRFWHLLLQSNTLFPMLKHWSPMSIGAWALLLFGAFALASFLAALAETRRISWRWPERFRPPGMLGRVFTATGALFGLYVAGYTGVMLAVTNRPLWSDTPLLGMLLIVSATSISAAFILLIARTRHWATPGVLALTRMEKWVIVLEFLALVAVVVSLGAVARIWLSVWGVALAAVVVLGMMLPLLLGFREHWLRGYSGRAAALLVLIGGFILRTTIVFTQHGIEL
jgi:formate-dependent nitrite reductase membrane component NrfD